MREEKEEALGLFFARAMNKKKKTEEKRIERGEKEKEQ